MKLSNTMIMNCEVMPTKKAFTLAEVLITLSILGVVAALTIPSLVNRQSEMAAIVKLKKAISQFEQVSEVYMAENEAQNIVGMVQTKADGTKDTTACGGLSQYFKQVTGAGTCDFTTADGVRWKFKADGTQVIAYDSNATSPKYGVAMNANGGVANPTTTDADLGTTAITAADSSLKVSGAKLYTAANFMKISKPADVDATTNSNPTIPRLTN